MFILASIRSRTNSMRKSARLPICLLITLLGMVGCEGDDRLPQVEAGRRVSVTSSAFQNGGTIPTRFTCDGENEPPDLEWEPVDADEYAITLTDPDAPGATFVHWVVWDVDGAAHSLQTTDTFAEGTNDFDEVGYGGPCPPEGDDPHRYVFTVYALAYENGDPTESLGEDVNARDLLEAIDCCVAAKGTLTGRYERS